MNARERTREAFSGNPVRPLLAQPICMSFSARQAGLKFSEYARDHRVLAEAQLAIAETYDLDVLSLTSDPCREASDCGAEIVWFDDEPPMPDPMRPRIASREDLDRMEIPDPLGGGRMHECCKGIRYLRERGGDRPVMGWIEGPIAEAADLRGLTTVMEDMIDAPEYVHRLFEFVTEMEIRYMHAQVDAGAEIIGIGDAAASLIGPELYREFVLPYEKRMAKEIRDAGAFVRLHICGNTTHLARGMAEVGAHMVDFDSPTDLRSASAAMPPGTTVLGNIDPVRVLRAGPPDRIRAEMASCHLVVGPSFAVGAGCEAPADTAPEHFSAMVEYARSPQF